MLQGINHRVKALEAKIQTNTKVLLREEDYGR